jgi:putative ABC transport system ATP-binding protein
MFWKKAQANSSSDHPSPGQVSPAEPLVRLQDVVKVYPTANGGFTALKGVSAEFYPGEFVGVMGKSGAGKTTLLNMITGIDRITSGEVKINGVSVHRLNENAAANWRGRNIGIVYQNFRLMPTISVLDNVLLPVDFCGNYNPLRSPEKAMELLREVELEDHAFKLPSAVSGGQQQRVAIARALANAPPILVADEPTGRLDSATAEIIVRMFEQLARRGKLIIMATHDTSLIQRFTHRLVVADGEIVEDSREPARAP